MALSGVQRVAKFVKYLPQFGWDPVVLTVDPGGYFAYDEDLLQEVLDAGVRIERTPSLDPTRLFRSGSTVQLPKESARKWFSGISQTLFIPDNKIGWKRYALRKARELIKDLQPDAIFSSAPPYTSHLIATELAKTHRLPVLVDFRDDWVGNPRHVYPTAAHRWVHRRMEGNVLSRSTRISTINEYIRASLLRSHEMPDLADKVLVLPQGYDEKDFDEQEKRANPGIMSFLYSGVFYDVQTPDPFLKGMQQFLAREPEWKDRISLDFVGLFPETSLSLVIDLGIERTFQYHGYVKHREATRMLRTADVLWMTVGKRAGAEGISTGKLYEYMGSRKPIMALVPDGAVKETLAQYGPAYFADPDDESAISRVLSTITSDWKAGRMLPVNEEYVRGFERKHLTGILSKVLDEMVDSTPFGQNRDRFI